MAERNYTLGRGRVFFARFAAGETPGPYRYLGNTPELNLTIETEDLEHVSSESGVREVDDSVALDVTRTGTMICDDIQLDNLALFFFGSRASVAVMAAMGQLFSLTGPISADEVYQLGLSDIDRVGHRNIGELADVMGGRSLMLNATGPALVYSAATIAAARVARDAAVTAPANGDTVLLRYGSAGAGFTYKYSVYDTTGGTWSDHDPTDLASGDNYRLDKANGLLEVLKVPSAGLDGIQAYYDVAAGAYARVISGSTPVEGALRFIEDNPKGDDNLWVVPKLTLRPNGEVSLKGDEWRQIPFTLNIQKPTVGEAIYINGEPVAA